MKKTLLAITLLIGALASTRATSIFSDNFDYSPGNLVANSGGNWITISGGGNPATQMVTTNGLLLVSGSRAEDTEHEFPTLYLTNGPVANLYAAYTLKLVGAMPTKSGAYLSHFTGTNAFGNNGFRCRIWLSTNNPSGTPPDGKVWLSIAASNAGNTNDTWGTALDTNVTYTIVTRLVLSNGVSTVWVNPSSEGDTSVTSTEILPSEDQSSVLFQSNGIVNISSFGFRQAAGEGTEDQIDTLKIGTSFADVAGANTAPSITGIPTQSIPMNGVAGPLNFIVGDDGGTGSLVISNATSNPALITSGNIVFGGSFANRTVTLTPNTGVQGSSTITVYVSDGPNVSFITFLLTVGAPTITTVPNLITYSNLPPLVTTVTVGDAETGAAGVTVSNSFTTPALISSVSVTGSGATRTITVTPIVDQTGVSTITLYARDASANLVQTSFKVSVSPRLGTLLSDDFSYNDFQQANALVGADRDMSVFSPWASSSGTAQQLQVLQASGTIMMTSSNSEDVAANLAFAPFEITNGVLLYTRFTINMNVTNFPTERGSYIAHFKDTLNGTTFRDKVFTCKTNATVVGSYRVGLANAANDVSVTYPMDLVSNVTYTVVTRYNTGTGESVLWVNPADETSTHVAATDTVTPNFINAYGLREADEIGSFYLDNLKIATQFSDVVTPPVASTLQIVSSGGQATVTWSNSGLFYLMGATNVSGPYKYLSNGLAPATTPYMESDTSGNKFFRTVNLAP